MEKYNRVTYNYSYICMLHILEDILKVFTSFSLKDYLIQR